MDVEHERGNGRPRRPGAIRAGDVEPYTALRWVGTLFKAAAIFLAVAMLAEVIAGLRFEGTEALPVLLGEAARLAVIAVVLWGAGDLVRLLIDVGHDLRAQRVLLGRIALRIPSAAAPREAERIPEPARGRTEAFEPREEWPERSERPEPSERAEAQPASEVAAERPEARSRRRESSPERSDGREAA